MTFLRFLSCCTCFLKHWIRPHVLRFFDLVTLKVTMCRENSAEVSTTARAAAAAALLYGGTSSPAMMMDHAESPADCLAAAAAFRQQLLAATAVVAARTPGYIVTTPSAPAGVHRLSTSPATSPLSIADHRATADNDSARLKPQLDTGKHLRACNYASRSW